MRVLRAAIVALVLLPGLYALQAQTPPVAPVTLFEGARLIVGDGSTPIDDGAMLVSNGRILRVGRRGALDAPPGAARVDLSGKTVIPALIDAHAHIGYMKNLTSGPQNYTRENILESSPPIRVLRCGGRHGHGLGFR